MTQEIMDDIALEIGSRFPVGASTNTALSVTGEPYIVLTCGGIKEEGESQEVYATNILKAKELFMIQFDKYATGKDGGIYWRRKPDFLLETHKNSYGEITLCSINARFIITNKPVLNELKASFNIAETMV